MKEQVLQFLKEEDGATALEYGLIAGLVAVAIIAAFAVFSESLSGLFTKLKTAIDGISFNTSGTTAPK